MAARKIADQHAFGDFNLQPVRGKAGFQQNLMDQRRQIAMAKLDRRDIDSDTQRLRPRRCFAAGFAQDPFAERDDFSALLGQRDELAGDTVPRVG